MRKAFYFEWVSPKGTKSARRFTQPAALRLLTDLTSKGMLVKVRTVLVPK